MPDGHHPPSPSSANVSPPDADVTNSVTISSGIAGALGISVKEKSNLYLFASLFFFIQPRFYESQVIKWS